MKCTQTKLIVFTALFLVIFDNHLFFKQLLAVYPLSIKNLGFLVSLTVGLISVNIIFLVLVTSRHTLKPILTTLLFAAALAGYFMNNYSVVIDTTMVENILQTNAGEVLDLLNSKLITSLILFWLLPTLFVLVTDIEQTTWPQTLITKLKIVGLCTVVIFSMILSLSKFYTSFFREHKPLRYYTNPTYFIYSTIKYISERLNTGTIVVAPLGEDASTPETDTQRELIILIVGEAARADHFSLNGYSRETNPLLRKEDVISLSSMYSCGTSTAYSVPCMFSVFDREQFTDSKGKSYENLLDVLQHAGTNVLWRDNNSNSKGVALRVEYQDYHRPEINSICDSECRDEGMLVGLQEYIDSRQEGDILIVLHQMGNHGPAYFKRYPQSFEKFKPVCLSSKFDECTTDEIINAYDNAILYTDFFLSRVITLLKENDPNFETAMVYMSDHGESLGEYGVYLHGLPYSMAPDAQKHVAALFWFGKNFDAEANMLRQNISRYYSHDNLFHTILGMMEIQSAVYEQSLDMFFDENNAP